MSGSQRKRLVDALLLYLEIGFGDDEEAGGDDDRPMNAASPATTMRTNIQSWRCL